MLDFTGPDDFLSVSRYVGAVFPHAAAPLRLAAPLAAVFLSSAEAVRDAAPLRAAARPRPAAQAVSLCAAAAPLEESRLATASTARFSEASTERCEQTVTFQLPFAIPFLAHLLELIAHPFQLVAIAQGLRLLQFLLQAIDLPH